MPLMTGIKRTIDHHYNKLVKVNCNTCDVGTWTINKAVAEVQHTWGAQMKAFFAKFRKNTNNFVPCATNAAMSCASSTAEKAPSKSCSKILVVCKASTFSDKMMQYATTMASKTKSEIVALNLDEKNRDFDQFRAQSNRNIEQFAKEAEKSGLKFSHLVFCGEEENVLDALYAKDSGYRYVMDDMPALMGKKHSIPVYSRVSLRVG